MSDKPCESLKRDKSLDSFQASLRAAARGIWGGDLDPLMGADAIYSAIRRGFEQAFTEGAAEYGIKEGERTEAESKRLGELIGENYQYVARFVQWIYEHSKANGFKFVTIENRLSEWVNRYEYVKTVGREMANADQKELWTYGPTEHCFLMGTIVTCQDSDKEIQDIKIGDKIWTVDGWKPVVKLFKRPYYGNLIEVRVRDRVVVSTPEHPYLTQRGWIPANQLGSSDNVMLSQDFNNTLLGHILLPYTLDNIAARCQIFILGLISFLLSFLSIGKWFKSWVAVPVIAIGLNDKITDSNINNEFGLNQIMRIIGNARSVEIFKQLQFKLGWLRPFKSPMSLKQICYHSLFLFRISIIKFFSLLSNVLPFHRVMIAHIFSGPRVNNFMRHFFGQSNFKYANPIKDLPVSKSEFLGDLFRTLMRIMNLQIFVPLFSPQFRGVTTTIFANPIGAMSTNWAGLFGESSFGFAHQGVMDISTPNRAESLGSIRIWLVTLFAKLHRNSTPFIQILYHKRVTVYNLEIEDAHHYLANGFIVHNCCDCLRLHGRVYRNSQWARYGLEPHSPNLACGGYHCKCIRKPTDLPITKGRPPALRGPGGCGKVRKKELELDH